MVPVLPGADPPDFYCKVDGEHWAVEVTHSNQQVGTATDRKARDEIEVPLIQFGKSLGKITESLRRSQYLLILRWPPSGTSWGKWRKQITEGVVDFVQSGESGERTLSGICGSTIHSTTSGYDWQVAVAPSDNAATPSGAMLCEISKNVHEMIAFALSDKALKTSLATGASKNVLVLINTYPFGNDPLDVRRCITEILIDRQDLNAFDYIFYQNDRRVCLVYSRS